MNRRTPAALALALLVPLAGCGGPENGAALPDHQTSPTASDQPTTPAGSPTAAGGPADTPVAPADRPTPPLSRTDPPTLRRPTTLPKGPTDNRPTDLIAGRITRGGTGPCYGLVDENDREYALHGPDAGELRVGSFVTLRIAPPTSSFDCGPGIPMRIVSG